VRVALAQINPTVGDLAGNADRVVACIHQARRSGARVVAFPELVISGYPPEDLLLKDHFVDDCREALDRVLPATEGIVALVGLPLEDRGGTGNAVAVLADGLLRATYHKIWLPNYAVFDEDRYFQPGDRLLLLDLGGIRVSVNVCEDIWCDGGPTEEAALLGGAEVVFNLSMSPYHRGKGRDREAMLVQRARDSGAFIAYVNGVGGQDELVFDGESFVIDPRGEVLVRGPQFQEALLLVDLESDGAGALRGTAHASGRWPLDRVEVLLKDPARGSPFAPPADADLPCTPSMGTPLEPLDPHAEVYGALCLGVRDYVTKNGFEHVVIGMSGGIDSALTACIAVDALGADHVTAVSMPSRYSSPGTRSDACLASERLGVAFLELSIERVFEAYLELLAPVFAGRSADLAEENIQARIRGNLLMALSNEYGWLVLTTGNKSEMAVGYATLYGDMAGGFAVIKDVPKTLVYALSVYRNTLGPGEGPIPRTVIERPPSAELRPDQTDQDSLPPYEILDQIIEAYVVLDESVDEIVARGLDRDVVEQTVSMIDRNEYKRRQAAPGVRITPKAFGKDRRLPLTNRYRG
jgi:NAD+ synthase (glutamine-hydrolysing)